MNSLQRLGWRTRKTPWTSSWAPTPSPFSYVCVLLRVCLLMPVSWLSFTSTRRRVHLLDYPYIFNPSSLVSYFRAINFSRMSRAYEESSSLQSRINAIIAPDSLVTESHQKNVLQDLLKTWWAKVWQTSSGQGCGVNPSSYNDCASGAQRSHRGLRCPHQCLGLFLFSFFVLKLWCVRANMVVGLFCPPRLQSMYFCIRPT